MKVIKNRICKIICGSADCNAPAAALAYSYLLHSKGALGAEADKILASLAEQEGGYSSQGKAPGPGFRSSGDRVHYKCHSLFFALEEPKRSYLEGW